MHRVFYRFFDPGYGLKDFFKILFGTFFGGVFGLWMYLYLSCYEFSGLGLRFDLASGFSLLLCGTLPLLLAGFLSFVGFRSCACFVAPGLGAALLSFSALVVFQNGGYDALLGGVLLFSGRLICMLWLYLYLLLRRELAGSAGSFLLMLFLSVLTLFFFAWLTEPSLKALSIIS